MINTHIVITTVLTTALDDIDVELRDLLVGSITAPVVGEGEVAEQEVDWDESTIKVGQSVRESLVHAAADFLALQCAGGREDGELGQHLERIDGTPLVGLAGLVGLVVGVVVEEFSRFMLDETGIGAEGVSVEGPFHEFLLLHELLVGDSVHNVVAENGCSQVLVGVLSVKNRGLATEDEVVSLRTETDSNLTAEENESKDVSELE